MTAPHPSDALSDAGHVKRLLRRASRSKVALALNMVQFVVVVPALVLLPSGLPTWSLVVTFVAALAVTDLAATQYQVGAYTWGISFSTTIYAMAWVLAPGTWMIPAAVVAALVSALLHGLRSPRVVVQYVLSRSFSLAAGVIVAQAVSTFVGVRNAQLPPDASWLRDDLASPGFPALLFGAFAGCVVAYLVRRGEEQVTNWVRAAKGRRPAPLANTLVVDLSQVTGAAAIGRVLHDHPSLIVPLLVPLSLTGWLIMTWMRQMQEAAVASAVAASQAQVHGPSVLDAAHVVLQAIGRLTPKGTVVKMAVTDPEVRAYVLSDGTLRYIPSARADTPDWAWVNRTPPPPIPGYPASPVTTTHGGVTEILLAFNAPTGQTLKIGVWVGDVSLHRQRTTVNALTSLAGQVDTWFPDRPQDPTRTGEAVVAACVHMISLARREQGATTREVLAELHDLEQAIAAHLGNYDPGTGEDERADDGSVTFVRAGVWGGGLSTS